MRSGADTCQRSPLCLPLAALTISSSKAAPAAGETGGYFPLHHHPKSSSAWFRPWSAHSWTFSSFQLPNVGASATSDSESRAIVTATERVLSLKLGGLGTHKAEQLTHWERPRMFLSFMFLCGTVSLLFKNGNGTFKGKVVLDLTLPQNICPVKKFTTLGPLLFFFSTLYKTSVASLMKGRLSKTVMFF